MRRGKKGKKASAGPGGGYLGSFQFLEMNPNKFLAHFDRVRALAEGRDCYPVTVELDPVSFCNHSCSWCVDPRHSDCALDKSFVFRLLEELKGMGVKGIVFKGGGEPTLHSDFVEISEKARAMGFETGLVTNGSRLEDIAQAVANSFSYVRVSIDGPTAASHRKAHGSDDFFEIISGTKALIAERKRLGNRHPIVGLSFAMDHSSRGLVGDAVDLGEGLGADYVLFRTPFFEEVGRKPTMTPKQSFALKAAFAEAAAKHKGKTRVLVDYWVSDSEARTLGAAGKGSPRRGGVIMKNANGIEHITGECLASPLLCVISANRKVYPCCNLRFLDDWAVGTIDYSKGESFGKIWRGKKRKDVLKRMEKTECIASCTHPLSKYNEAIAYLRSEKPHSGFL